MSSLKCDLPWPWLASWQSLSWPHRKPLCTWHSHPSLLSSRGAPQESKEKKENKPVISKRFSYIQLTDTGVFLQLIQDSTHTSFTWSRRATQKPTQLSDSALGKHIPSARGIGKQVSKGANKKATSLLLRWLRRKSYPEHIAPSCVIIGCLSNLFLPPKEQIWGG